MLLKKSSFQAFASYVNGQGKKIIVYGAGVIGQTVAPYWLEQYQLDKKVICYVDADVHKQGMEVPTFSQEILICSLDALKEHCGDYILLVTVSNFEPVIHDLEQLDETKDVETYFLPLMLLDLAHGTQGGGVVRMSQTQMIPKRIHYCWFSGNPIPERLQRCIDSWKRCCPDYEIVRWDENNYNIHQNKYMEQAYALKRWGFIPDIARLDILYQYGGIYLDTDVELLRSLDELLYQPAFCGVEKWGSVNFGGCSGSQAGNPFVREILDFRRCEPFQYEDGSLNQTVCGYYETLPLIKHGLKVNMETQVIGDGMMTVYAPDFFHPFDYVSGETRRTKNTFSVHHFSGTWLGKEAVAERARAQRRYREFLAGLEDQM